MPLAAAARQRARNAIDLSGLRVLVIERNIQRASAITSYLSAHGAIPRVARDGGQGLAMIREMAEADEPLDVALWAYDLARAEGLTADRAMIEASEFKRTRMLLLAPQGLVSLRAEAERIGFAGTVPRPVGRAALVRAVAGAIGRAVPIELAGGPVVSAARAGTGRSSGGG